MKKMEHLIKELEKHIPNQEAINTNISKSSIGWHIEHSLLTINRVIEALKRSDINNYKRSFNITRTFVFTMNKIPRGRAQSPKIVQPANDYTVDTLNSHINVSKKELVVLPNLKADNYFEHPVFGHLKLKSTIKFLAIHTKHHLDIINDIINTKV